MSSPLFWPEGAQPTDSPMARWSDGFEHTVTDITCEELQSTAAAGTKRDMPTVVWEGSNARAHIECSRNGDKIEHCSRACFERGPQICQIRVHTFGDDVTIAEPAAAKFTTKLCKLYCEGGVDECNLMQQRDE